MKDLFIMISFRIKKFYFKKKLTISKIIQIINKEDIKIAKLLLKKTSYSGILFHWVCAFLCMIKTNITINHHAIIHHMVMMFIKEKKSNISKNKNMAIGSIADLNRAVFFLFL